MSDIQSPMVETEWLAKNLGAPGIVVLDGTWHIPTTKRDARAEYNAEHIPGALFFAINAASIGMVPLPHIKSMSGLFLSQPLNKIIPAANVSLTGASPAWLL